MRRCWIVNSFNQSYLFLEIYTYWRIDERPLLAQSRYLGALTPSVFLPGIRYIGKPNWFTKFHINEKGKVFSAEEEIINDYS